ncbi:helix-turn-helix domain-containing protein [Hyphobacterium sp. HN65]|uniref:Helix-turn-helix domain-containing protein n=1 Tax=Hyphobacterium lacteum TaxID=3116575 RepID=A0ABU7LQK3_9PROT|nr:helix-turn-helix domain-containing protein [Hyphobacterium sp. HN65]MEE2525916.1 helix-turn-helix domain-containing protein [Hyphobacterium sp. HN65]
MPADACLGGYREWRLDGQSGLSCEAVWIYEAGDNPVAHRLLPDGKPSLAIRLRRDRQGDATGCDLIISGGLTRASWYRPAARETMIGLRLYPEAAQAAAALDPREFSNGVHEAPRLLVQHFARLLGEAPLMHSEAVARALTDGLQTIRPGFEHELQHRAAAGIRASAGRVSIAGLAKHLGIGDRQLRRRFEQATGMTPKQYGRLLRHLNAIRLAETVPRPDWAGIAVEAGYADQSHMIREARALSAESPARLHAERRAESEMSNTIAA